VSVKGPGCPRELPCAPSISAMGGEGEREGRKVHTGNPPVGPKRIEELVGGFLFNVRAVILLEMKLHGPRRTGHRGRKRRVEFVRFTEKEPADVAIANPLEQARGDAIVVG